MGTFAGHVAPGALLLVYGIFLHLHSIHTHFLLSHPYRRAFLHPPTANKLLSTSSNHHPPSPSLLSTLLLHTTLRRTAYIAAIILAAILIPAEISHWNGSWSAMASPQHATMYGMVALSAVVGLWMDVGWLPEGARVVVGGCFVLCGAMFAGHSQHGEYNTAIHVVLAYLFYAAGGCYVLYAGALSTCRTAAAYFPVPSLAVVSSSAAQASPVYSLVLSFLICSLSVASRLTSLSIVLCGTWMLHIAFKLFSPYTLPPFLAYLLSSTPPSPAAAAAHAMGASGHGGVRPVLDGETHTLVLTLAWHYLAVVSVGLVVEVVVRRVLGGVEWNDGAGVGGVGHRSYEKVSKFNPVAGEEDDGEDGRDY